MIQSTDRQMHYGRVAGAPHGSAARAALWLLACGLFALGGVAQGQPTDLTLTNATITSGSTSYAATNSITAGPAFTVGGSASVSFTAGSRIVLNPGFQATAGSAPVTFQASIGVVAPPPDFTVSLAPSSQTVTAGGSTTYTVTVTALNGFNGPVSLSWPSGLPTLTTYTLSPATVTGSGTAQLTVTTNSAAAAGTYSFTVTGTSGTLVHTSNSVGLTVNAAAPPSIGMTVTAASSTTVAAGGSATYAVTVTALNGFSGIVGFQVTGFPDGAMYNFSPWTVAITQGSTATTMMTVTTPAGGAAGGPYSLVVTAAGGGVTATGWGTLSVSAPAPDFTVSVGTGGTAPGSSALYALQVTSLNGFAGAVSLSAGGLPAGVTASFSQNNLSGGWTSQLTVNVPSGTPPGSYTFTITGVSGGLSHVWNVALPISQSSPSTVAASQTGLSFSVDAVPYTAAQTFSWQTGGTHTLSAPGSQTDALGNTYVFSGWSDGGDMTHSVTANPALQSYAVTYSPAATATKLIPWTGGVYGVVNDGNERGPFSYCVSTSQNTCTGNLDSIGISSCQVSGKNVQTGSLVPHSSGAGPTNNGVNNAFTVKFTASADAEDGNRTLTCTYNGSPLSLANALTVYDATPVITGVLMGQPDADANGIFALTISGRNFGSWRGSVVFAPSYSPASCESNEMQKLGLTFGGGYTAWSESQVVVSAYACPVPPGQSGVAVISAGTNTSGSPGTFLAGMGTQATSNHYPVLIGSPPTISSMVQDETIYAGGQGAWVTLYGSNFGSSAGSIQVCTTSSGACTTPSDFSVSLSGNYYCWNPGQINFFLSAPYRSAGVTFYVQVTDSTHSFQSGRWGFTPTAQPTVTVSPNPAVAVLNSQLTLTATVVGSATYNYAWSISDTSVASVASCGNQATCTLTAGANVSTATVIVNVTDSLNTAAGGGTATVNVVDPCANVTMTGNPNLGGAGDSPYTPGAPASFHAQAPGASSVAFQVNGSNLNPYSGQPIQGTQSGSSSTWAVSIPTGNLARGGYSVTPIVTVSGAAVSCTAKMGFFTVGIGAPLPLGPVNCASMTGTWLDQPSNSPNNVSWTLVDQSGAISGYATAILSGGNGCTFSPVWSISGSLSSYKSQTQQYTLYAASPSPPSGCDGSIVADGFVQSAGTFQAGLPYCGLGSGTFTSQSVPNGLGDTVTVAERIPQSENGSFSNWNDQYGYPASATFNMTLLSSGGDLPVFGGRDVGEYRPTAAETAANGLSASDGCYWLGAPWDPSTFTRLAETVTWSVQVQGNASVYGPDYVGIYPNTLGYIQHYAPVLQAGPNASCVMQYPQKMQINMETTAQLSAREPYGVANHGFNLIQFTVTPTTIQISRGNATTVAKTFYF